jgi:fumarate reductase subunit D
MARSSEPLWWGPFSAGMMIGALFIPGLILVTGFLWPFLHTEDTDAEFARNLLVHPLTRLFLFVVISSSLFHWAHRFRYVVFDLGLKEGKTAVATLCYGTAIVGTVWTALIALGIA